MNQQRSTITQIVAIAIGVAVFLVLGRFLSIPIGIPNTSVETTYPFLSLMAAIFGPAAAGLIGLLGHALKDLTMGYGIWWSWVITSGLTGIGYGLVGKALNIEAGRFSGRDIVKFNIGQFLVNLLCWGLLAPALDIFIYAEPANKVFVQGIFSTVSNSLAVAVIGTILIKAYASTQTQSGSLRKD